MVSESSKPRHGGLVLWVTELLQQIGFFFLGGSSKQAGGPHVGPISVCRMRLSKQPPTFGGWVPLRKTINPGPLEPQPPRRFLSVVTVLLKMAPLALEAKEWTTLGQNGPKMNQKGAEPPCGPLFHRTDSTFNDK